MILRPKLGQITQGTVFTCAKAESYSCAVFGLVITARCDVAQEKTPLFNYLPIVPLAAWLARDGRELLCARAEKEVDGQLRACLKQAGFSESILDTETLAVISAKLFPESSTDKKILSGRKQFLDGKSKREAIVTTASGADMVSVQKLGDLLPGIRRALLKELITQRLAGYYFLKSISPERDEGGYVVLMREIRHLPRAIANAVAAGAIAEEVELIDTDLYERKGCLDFSCEEFAYPIGEVQSPYIEHIMQTFSTLFARIGLPDAEPGLHDTLWTAAISPKAVI